MIMSEETTRMRDTSEEPAPPRGPHVPTICFGIVLGTVALLVGLGQVTSFGVDLSVVLPTAMVVLGSLLLLGALLGGLRRR
jgi:hypothetical protein